MFDFSIKPSRMSWKSAVMRATATSLWSRCIAMALPVFCQLNPSCEAGEQETHVTGRVLNVAGDPVPGARVYVAASCMPMITALSTPRRDYVILAADDRGRFEIPRSLGLRDRLGSDAGRIWAVDQDRVSRSVGFDVESQESRSIELTLRDRHAVRVVVHSAAGRPVAGVGVDARMVDAEMEASDVIAAVHRVVGKTDQSGTFLASDLPAITISGAYVELSLGAQTLAFEGDRVRQRHEGGVVVLEVELPPGRRVSGRILDTDRSPARGMLIVDRWEGAPVPQIDRYVESDEYGRFAIEDVPLLTGSALRVCSPAGASPGDAAVYLPRPLAIAAIPTSGRGPIDVGDIILPRRRDVLVTVLDTAGRPAVGSVTVTWPGVSDGGRSERLDHRGQVVLRQLPAGVTHELDFNVVHPELGEIEFFADLGATAESAKYRATGAGLLIVQFLDAGGEPLRVEDPSIQLTGGAISRVTRRGECADVRIPLRVGVRVALEVEAKGLRSRPVDAVVVRPDAATIVQVRLHPR